MNPVFAIIGCGRIAKRHAEQMIKHGRLVAVCDIIPEKADELAAIYNAKAYYSIDDLLASETDLSLAVVCTPNGLHASHSIKVLESGNDVLCEKPLCTTVEDGKVMIAAAEKAGKRLFVVKQNRYNPQVFF